MVVRHAGDKPFAFPAPAAERGHVGLGPDFIDEHQPLDVEPRLMLLPPIAAPGDVTSFLLGRAPSRFVRANAIP